MTIHLPTIALEEGPGNAIKSAPPAHLPCAQLWVGPRDRRGRPHAIAEREFANSGFWTYILPPAGIEANSIGDGPAPWVSHAQQIERAVALPTFKVQRPEERGRGRPPLSDTEPYATRYAAWLTNMVGASSNEVARALHLSNGSTDDRALAARVGRYVRRGQQRLHAEGVIPWVAWPDGELSEQWYLDGQAFDALNRWFALARAVADPLAQIVEAAEQFIDLLRRNPWLRSLPSS